MMLLIYFKVTYAFKSYSDFYLIVSYDRFGAIVPDEYTVKSSYTIDGYTINYFFLLCSRRLYEVY